MSTIPQLLCSVQPSHPERPSFTPERKRSAGRVRVPVRNIQAGSNGNLPELFDLTSGLVRTLQELGVQKGTKVAILAETSAMWAALDIAIISLGAVTVGIYPNATGRPSSMAHPAFRGSCSYRRQCDAMGTPR